MELIYLFVQGWLLSVATALQGGTHAGSHWECLKLRRQTVDVTKAASLGCGESADLGA